MIADAALFCVWVCLFCFFIFFIFGWKRKLNVMKLLSESERLVRKIEMRVANNTKVTIYCVCINVTSNTYDVSHRCNWAELNWIELMRMGKRKQQSISKLSEKSCDKKTKHQQQQLTIYEKIAICHFVTCNWCSLLAIFNLTLIIC